MERVGERDRQRGTETEGLGLVQALFVSGRFQASFLKMSCSRGSPGSGLDGATVLGGEEDREAKR